MKATTITAFIPLFVNVNIKIVLSKVSLNNKPFMIKYMDEFIKLLDENLKYVSHIN